MQRGMGCGCAIMWHVALSVAATDDDWLAQRLIGNWHSHGVERLTTSIPRMEHINLHGWVDRLQGVASRRIPRWLLLYKGIHDRRVTCVAGGRRCASTITLRGRVGRIASPPQASPPKPLRHDGPTTAAVHGRCQIRIGHSHRHRPYHHHRHRRRHGRHVCMVVSTWMDSARDRR